MIIPSRIFGATKQLLMCAAAVAVINCGPATQPVGPGTQPPGPPGGEMHPPPPDNGDGNQDQPGPPTATTPGNPPVATQPPPPPNVSQPPATRPKPTAGPTGMLKGILAAHNRVRANHCVPAMKWSKKLAAHAQDWANKLRDKGCAFDHRPRNPYGENLSMYGPPGGTNSNEITMGWYNEIKQYNYSKPGFSFQAGHFTQVIWRATTELGCGRSVCRGAEIWVCNYAPAGNVQGGFRRHVPRKCK